MRLFGEVVKNFFRRAACLLLCICIFPLGANTEKPFVVVVPSFNNVHYLQRNLDSIFAQQYDNYRVIYIDDASTDDTGAMVAAYLEEHDLIGRCTLIRNEKNQGALYNLYQAIHGCEDNEIIYNLDGDDWYAHDQVFATLNEAYLDPEVWLTYGSLQMFPNGLVKKAHRIPGSVVQKNEFRKYMRVDLFARSFYAGLFKQIKKPDLLYNGQFFEVMWDNAMMLPMLEMAGERFWCSQQVHYIYNRETPLNDTKKKNNGMRRINAEIRKRKPYSRLENCPWGSAQ